MNDQKRRQNEISFSHDLLLSLMPFNEQAIKIE